MRFERGKPVSSSGTKDSPLTVKGETTETGFRRLAFDSEWAIFRPRRGNRLTTLKAHPVLAPITLNIEL